MPRNNGVYTLPPVYLAETGETIQPNQHNIPLQDVASALTGSVARDGSSPMLGNLPMNGRRITNLAAGTAAGDAVRMDQLPDVSPWLESVSDLTMAADRIPYATGAATAALAVFTAAGRAIVGAVDAAAQRVALGLGSLATKNKAAIADIDATGTPGSGNFLRGDGAWSGVLGVDQTWQDVISSRSAETSYQNTTGKPIMVNIVASAGSSRYFQVSTDNSTWVNIGRFGSEIQTTSFIVPNNSYYRTQATGNITVWAELR